MSDIQLPAEGVHSDDASKMRRAAELLKAAASSLYEVGSPECIQLGEKADDILRELIPLLAEKELTTRLADILRGFANKVVAIVQRAHREDGK